MLTKSVVRIALAGAMALASISPTLAKMKKEPNACATSELRCTAATTCDKDGWCKVYGCVINQTVLLPFACNEKLGGCLQKHC